jgi:hypothetical protein
MADTTFVFKQAIVTFYRKSNKQNTPPEDMWCKVCDNETSLSTVLEMEIGEYLDKISAAKSEIMKLITGGLNLFSPSPAGVSGMHYQNQSITVSCGYSVELKYWRTLNGVIIRINRTDGDADINYLTILVKSIYEKKED